MEYSQSGQGIHIFIEGSFPQNINLKTIGIEVYGWDRYIALTGDVGDGKHFKISNMLYNKQTGLDGLWEELKQAQSQATSLGYQVPSHCDSLK